MKHLHRLLALSCLSLLAACGGGGGDDDRTEVEKPKAVAAADPLTAEYKSTFTLDGSGSSSPRNGALNYDWSLKDKPAGSKAALVDAKAAKTTFVADVPGSYVAELLVNDGIATSAASQVKMTATNVDPVAVLESSSSVLVGALVELDGSHSVAPTGAKASELKYHWSLDEQPSGSSVELINSTQAKASFLAQLKGAYKVSLIVSYGDRQSEPVTTTVLVGTHNVKPVADIGGPYEIERGQTVKLDGSKSYDPDEGPDPLMYRWSFVDPAPMIVKTNMFPMGSKQDVDTAIKGADQAVATFTPEASGTYYVYFYVFDGVSVSDVQSTTITVTTPADAPKQKLVASLDSEAGSPVYSFYKPVGSNEWELGYSYIVYDSGWLSWDPDARGDSLSTHTLEWVSVPNGFSPPAWTGAGRYRFTPDVEGTYKIKYAVKSTGGNVSDPIEYSWNINTAPYSNYSINVTADSETLMVGKEAWFDASKTWRVGGQELTFHWHVLDKPNGSNASLKFSNVTVEGSSGQRVVLKDARAGLVTDKPGIYRVVVYTTNKMGHTSVLGHAMVLAKKSNSAPVVDRIFLNGGNTNFDFASNRNFDAADQPYVIDHAAKATADGTGTASLAANFGNVVDPDGDSFYYMWSLTQPEGSKLSATAEAQYFAFGWPEVPGAYAIDFSVSDGMAVGNAGTYRFNVVERENYPSLLLEDLHSVSINYQDREEVFFGGLKGEPQPRQRTFPYLACNRRSLNTELGENVVKNYRLTAVGGDYTVHHLSVSQSLSHPDGFTGKFVGLEEGQIIRKGSSVEFSLVLNQRIDNYAVADGDGEKIDARSGIAFRFEVAEKPDWTFEYQPRVPTVNIFDTKCTS